MHPHGKAKNSRQLWPWGMGLLAFLWLLLRSGTNPRRLTYPCQRVAMPLAYAWLVALASFLASALLLRKIIRYSAIMVPLFGALWLIGSLPETVRSSPRPLTSLPTWQVSDPISTVFVMDSIPSTSGSLAAGDASVPDEHLVDAALDTMLALLETDSTYLHRTASRPNGIVGPDNVVIIKGNFQWTSRNTTSTDRIKGLIWRILQHPEGFSGEILVCDNTQDIGTGIAENDNNSEDPAQSLPDVVNTFAAKGYPVYYLDWVYIWDAVADEYSAGDYSDGYVYDPATKITYPKFQTPTGDYYVSLRHGVWDSLATAYDSEKLCIIDFPVLKSHGWAGATIAVKNWIGVLTTAYAEERFGSFNYMHTGYFFGSYALVARVMAVTYPRLTIVDAAWTTTDGPANLTWLENTQVLLASTDPVAASWYAAKHVLTPIARYPNATNPDFEFGTYRYNLDAWASFLADSAGFPCTRDSASISVYDRGALYSGICGDADNDGDFDLGDCEYVYDYLTADGPPPRDRAAADVDVCGTINVSDIVEMVAYLPSEEPPPCDPADSCYLPSDGHSVTLGTPVEHPAAAGDSLAIPIYLSNQLPLAALSLGFAYGSDEIEISSLSTDGSVIPLPDLVRLRPVPDLNQALIAWVDTSGDNELPPQSGGLLATVWVQIPAGLAAQSIDLDSSFVSPGGEFILAPVTGGAVRPAYVDAGDADIVILPCGDADGDEIVNISDAVYLITYIFGGGPPPDPLLAGDADCNGIVNISDAVYLISYIFGGGPAPCAECN